MYLVEVFAVVQAYKCLYYRLLRYKKSSKMPSFYLVFYC
jgi:hypothetical protein